MPPIVNVLLPYITPILVGFFGAWLRPHIKDQADAARAAAIAQIAKDVATAVYANNPTMPWVGLVSQVVTQLADAAPTTNQDAIRRAATSALIAAGAKPA
jgi:hypothetical protein